MEKNKVISINESDVYIQASNNDKVFVIDRYVYDNFWDTELSKYSWICDDNVIRAKISYHKISLARKIADLLQLNPEQNSIILHQRIINNIINLRVSNFIILYNNGFKIIDDKTYMCICRNENVAFLYDAVLHQEISKYRWRYESGTSNRFRGYINGNNMISLKEVILRFYNKHDLIARKGAINSILLRDSKLHNNIADYRLQNFLFCNDIVSINNHYVFIKASNNNTIFIIDKWIYDMFWASNLSLYYWNAIKGYISSNAISSRTHLHRYIIELLGIDISNLDIHHINLNPWDNSLNNLFICSPSVHAYIHSFITWRNKIVNIKSNIQEIIDNNYIIPEKYTGSFEVLANEIESKEKGIINPFIFYN